MSRVHRLHSGHDDRDSSVAQASSLAPTHEKPTWSLIQEIEDDWLGSYSMRTIVDKVSPN